MPDFAKVRRWPSCEVNGLILVWFHCDGKDPEWTVPEQEEITQGKWVYRGRTEHFINAHIQVGLDVCEIYFSLFSCVCFLKYSTNGGATSSLLQEIPENAADLAHLGHLHTPSMTSGVDLRYINSKTWEFLRHDWKVRIWFKWVNVKGGLRTAYDNTTAKSCCIISKVLLILFVWITWSTCSLKVQWEPESEPNQHCSQMFVKHSLTVFGLHFALLDIHVVARQVKLITHFAHKLIFSMWVHNSSIL